VRGPHNWISLGPRASYKLNPALLATLPPTKIYQIYTNFFVYTKSKSYIPSTLKIYQNFQICCSSIQICCSSKIFKFAAVPTTVAVVPLKTIEKWRKNKSPILQIAIERNYFITMHHQAGVNFENLTEVKFQDILLTGTGHRDRPGQTGTYGRST